MAAPAGHDTETHPLSEDARATTTTTRYARRLGPFDATMVVVGGIVGAGIFLSPAIVAQRVPTGGLVLAAWGLGGAIALLGALCFAELGARRPVAGGGYVYLRETFGPLPAFLYGWTLLLVINSGGISAVAVTFARYAADLVGAGPVAVRPLAVGAILLLTVINVAGVRPGAWTQNVLTVAKLAALAVLIVVGVVLSGDAAPLPPSAAPASPTDGGGAGGILSLGPALIPVLFAYGGWQHANHVAGEVRRPERTLPLALVVGVSIVVVTYLAANLAYLEGLGRPGLAASLAPASDTMRRVTGDAGARFIAVGIVVSTFGILNLFILAAPRVYQAMAADGLFFRSVGELHPRFRTPHRALVLQAVWACGLALTGTYGELLDWTVFGDWIFFGAVAATLFVYRRRDAVGAGAVAGEGAVAGDGAAGGEGAAAGDGAPAGDGAAARDGAVRPTFRVPLHPLVPALFVGAAVVVVASSVASNPRNALYGTLLIGAGVPVYLFWRGRGDADDARNGPPAGPAASPGPSPGASP